LANILSIGTLNHLILVFVKNLLTVLGGLYTPDSFRVLPWWWGHHGIGIFDPVCILKLQLRLGVR